MVIGLIKFKQAVRKNRQSQIINKEFEIQDSLTQINTDSLPDVLRIGKRQLINMLFWTIRKWQSNLFK